MTRERWNQQSAEPCSYPMSFQQEALWLTDQMGTGLPVYVVPWVHRLRGDLDLDALGQALTEVVARHEPLRTTLQLVGSATRQVVKPPAPVELEIADIGEVTGEARAQAISDAVSQPLDPLAGPLFRARLLRLSARDAILTVSIHHAAFDGWSIGVLNRDVSALYQAALAKRQADLPELATTYGKYAAAQRRRLDQSALARLAAYWHGRLSDAPPESSFPADRPRPPRLSFRGRSSEFSLSSKVASRLFQLARESRTTPFVIIATVVHALLSRLANQADVMIGVPVSLRDDLELEPLIGYFVNTVVLRQEVGRAVTFAELIEAEKYTVRQALQHKEMPFSQLVQDIAPSRSPSRNPFFQVLLVMEEPIEAPLVLPSVVAEPLPAHTGTAKFDLTITVEGGKTGLKGSIEYMEDIFEAASVARIGQRLAALLEGVAANPNTPIGDLPILPASERALVTGSWSAGAPSKYAQALAPELFDRQRRLRPDSAAVRCGDVTLSYAELDTAADRLLTGLLGSKNPATPIVGICLERSPELAIALLAVLKSGAAYLPLDPSYPSERLTFMMRDSRMQTLITSKALRDVVPNVEGVRVLVVDEAELPPATYGTAQGRAVRSEDLAYVIYTSGSTGTPKAVAMPHGPLANLLAWQADASAAGPGTLTLQFAALSFDVAFQEFFSTWVTGGTIVLLPEAARRDPEQLIEELCAHRIERLFLPFVALQQLAEHADLTNRFPKSLREVITAGEQLHVTQAVRRFFSEVDASLENQYGPSETHVVTAERLEGNPYSWPEVPPIGRPIHNARIYILDDALRPQPIGVMGEMCIGGPVVADGYLHRPEVTRERFVADPYGPADGRLYRTGDIGRFLHDGRVQFHGRRDGQVKVRGYRVELAEVEAALKALAGVADAVVVVDEQPDSSRRLVGYIIARNGSDLSVRQLRHALLAKVPEHLVPSVVFTVDSFPLTPSGKVDRRTLTARPLAAAAPVTSVQRPRDAVELQLQDIWAGVLSVPHFDINDNFFEVGGTSLLGIRLIAAVCARFGRELSPVNLFQAPTIATMAKLLRNGQEETLGKSLVALQSHGGRAPLFCFHPVGGNVTRYVDLARALGPNQPVYGLQAAGLDLTCEPYDQIEDMARNYLEEMRLVQRGKAFHLLGYSMGGLIAFEVAQQLMRADGKTPMVVMVDTTPDEEVDQTERYAIQIITEHFLRLDMDVDELILLNPDERIGRILEQAINAGSLPSDYNAARLRRMLQMYDVNGRAVTRYRLRPYPGTITLIRSHDSDHPVADLGWSKYCAHVITHELPGDHFSMMSADNMPTLAALLETLMAPGTHEPESPSR